MVENNVLPIRRGVADLACFTEAGLVYVVFSVAGEALRWCIPILDLGFVAGLALGFLGVGVSACEGKARLSVVKGGFVDRCDALLSAFMLGMAFATLPLFLQQAMKVLLTFYILADVFVAVLAQLTLCRFIEPFVAFGAGLFPLHVSLNHLSGH